MGAALACAAPALGGEEVAAPGAAPATVAPAFAPDRVIVEWKGGVPAPERADARSDSETSAIRTLGTARFQLLSVNADQSRSDAIDSLRADPNVRVAERDAYDAPMSVPNDPLFGQLWGLRNLGAGVNGFVGATAGSDINVVPAWDRTVGSPATVVADIDTGYRFDHPDLASRVWTNPSPTFGDLHGADFVGANAASPIQDGDPTDDQPDGGHGVHTAGTIGAAGNNGVGITGVAQNVRIMPLRVCAHYPPPTSAVRCPLSSQIAAINYAGAHGARVANMSLGGTTSSVAALDALAQNPQTLFVISAANDAQNNDSVPHYPCNYDPSTSSISGGIDNVLCVAATDQKDGLAAFSDYGASSVDVGAPGTETLSTYPFAPVYTENFETNDFSTKWTATTGAGFGRSNEAPLTSFGITDSPGATPTANTTVASTSSAVSLPSSTSCALSGKRFLSNGSGAFTYEVLQNGSSVFSFSPGNTAGTQLVSFNTVPIEFPGGGNLQVRFTFAAGASPAVTNGAWLDDLKVTCWQPPGSSSAYDFLEGTSMAAPHVTGSAALLFSLKPSATVTEVKNDLLSTVTPVASLNGKTTTGGRIDISRAMDALVPPSTAIDSGPSGSTIDTDAQFAFHRSDSAAASTFECKLDGGAFAACTSPKSYTVGVGAHSFSVRAKDPHGNLDPNPPQAQWNVVAPCKVPKLKGKTLPKAKKALKSARCKLGKVKPKKRKGRWIVKSTSPKTGSMQEPGTKVNLKMKKGK